MESPDTPPPDLADLRLASFQPHVGSVFRLPEEEIELELIEAADLGHEGESDDAERRRPFSIVFRGPAEPPLEQGIRKLDHAEIGVLTVFLVPLGPDDRGMRYEAVFT